MSSRKFLIAGVIVLVVIAFYAAYIGQQKREFALSQQAKGMVYVEVLPIQTALGWGYEIHVDGKSYIRQEFVPAVFGRRGFDTKEQAVAVGNKVVSNINSKSSPAISIKDLEELGIPIKASDTLQKK
ncbi:MAG: DUF4907 domain-containing protein [Bacteroidetes bacterium]|nr:DUF4907 domain-containing protein [Bacteroidota bacterium]MBS1932587.1 DUF4907 domain-containing protein [Bacteroidota bacterium]